MTKTELGVDSNMLSFNMVPLSDPLADLYIDYVLKCTPDDTDKTFGVAAYTCQ